jgi:uncharacterized membrane protein YbhN (UPF0104 family)
VTPALTWRPPRRLLLVSAVMVAGAAAIFATHRDQTRELWNNLTGVPAAALATAFGLVLCQLACQACRLWAILPRDVALTLGRTAYAFTVGEWLNIFAPARAGDALKVVLLNRVAGAQPISLPKATGAVLADKVIDVGSLVLLCAATGLAGLVRAGAEARLPGAGVVLGALGAAVLAVWGIRRLRPHWLERLQRLRREVVTGLTALRDPLRIVASTACSLGAWVAELLALRVLCGALGFPLTPPQLVLALVAVNLGVSVPVSFANLGVYEAALAFGLGQSGVPLASAVAIATLHHALELGATNLGAAALSLWALARRVPGRDPRPSPAISDER